MTMTIINIIINFMIIIIIISQLGDLRILYLTVRNSVKETGLHIITVKWVPAPLFP